MKKFKLPSLRRTKINTGNFYKINLVAGALHALQAIVMIMLAKDFVLPVTTSYLTFNVSTQTLDAATRNLFDMPFAWLTISFLLMSAAAHFIIATVYRRSYEKDLGKGLNKARWIEYAFSASTMMVAIAMLSGVFELSLLITIFALTAVMNLMGLVMELWNQTTKRTDWTSFIIGCFAGIVPWLVFLVYVLGATAYGSKGVPGFVYGIYVSIFIFFNCFAVNMYLQYKKIGPWKNYVFGETVYIILSLVAKSALAWQVFAGSLRG